MLAPVQQLQVLYRVFDVHDPTGAVLDIGLPRLHEFLHLPSAQLHGIRPVPRKTAIGIGITIGLDASSEAFISRGPAQFYKRLSFEWRGVAAGAVVLCKLLERS